ncbi:MAG: hypothetical protein Q8S33_04930 [Myxococcales bacterium]|nr:hypothetical protein [Myxococcales bacterium]
MRRLVLVFLLGLGCIRAMPIPWALRSGLQPVDVCDGGTANAGEAPAHGGSGSAESGTSPLSPREAAVCTSVLRKEPAAKNVDWEHVDFVYEFTTDDGGVVQSICARSVPFAPETATCLADKLQQIRFGPRERSEYTVHVSFD